MTRSEQPGQNEYQQRFADFSAELDRLAPVGEAGFTNVSAQLFRETPYSRITIQRDASINFRWGMWMSKKPGPSITTVMLRSREEDSSLRLNFPAGADMSTQVAIDEIPNDFIDDQTGMPIRPFLTSAVYKPARRWRRRKEILSDEQEAKHAIVGDVIDILQTLNEEDVVKSEIAEVADAERVGSDFKKIVEPRLEELLSDTEPQVGRNGVKYQNGSFLDGLLIVQKIIEDRHRSRERITYVVLLCDSTNEALAAQPNLEPKDRMVSYRKYLWAGEDKKVVFYGKGFAGLEDIDNFGANTKAGITELLKKPEDATPLFDALREVKKS